MKINNAGLQIIKESEGLRLEAYLDSENIPTIGYGHTQGVHLGMTINESQALKYLIEDIAWAETVLKKCVRVPLNENQASACISLIFNIGMSFFMKSTLLVKLNKGDYKGAAQEFLRWNKGSSGVLPGLSLRRAKEKKLFETKV